MASKRYAPTVFAVAATLSGSNAATVEKIFKHLGGRTAILRALQSAGQKLHDYEVADDDEVGKE